MSFIPVILWTDALVFLLIAVVSVGAWWVRRNPHLLLPWQRVARSSVGMVSLLVLSLFVLVGMLDSLHYRAALPEKSGGQTVYAPEVLSVFDVLASGLRSRTEKTYSAPLAAYLYSKESVETEAGATQRVYPRLKYGAAHLQDPDAQRVGDVVWRTLSGALIGLLVGSLVFFATSKALCRFTSSPAHREGRG